MNHRRPTIVKNNKAGTMRCILVSGVVLGALGVSPGLASASSDATTSFHLVGRAGNAVLTDCRLTDPVGTHCRAVNVVAYDDRAKDNGERVGVPGLEVTLFDVTLVADAPFYVAEPVGFGRVEPANVRINGFSGARASAADVPLCELFDCAPGAQQSITVDVQWSGFGPIRRDVYHGKSSDGVCSDNVHGNHAVRQATSTGTVDGVSWPQTSVPELAPTLHLDEYGAMQRCTTV